MRKFFDKVIFSFPIQLVFHHARRNLALVAIWGFFVACITGGIGKIYGIPYLFLDPEYLGSVGFGSFFLVGLSFGNLVMAFHITSYILDGHRFTFVGILERPFTKFSLNNSIIPFATLILYITLVIRFQLENEISTSRHLFLNLTGLLLGIGIMLTLFFLYFRFTNQDIFKYLTGAVDKRLRKSSLSRERMMNKLKETRSREYTVHSYLNLRLKLSSCKGLQDFYDKEAVLKVFDQNHMNSVLVELGIIVLLLCLGTFMDNPVFQIPAAASALFMLSIIVMLVGAVSFWFRDWGLAFVIVLYLIVNVSVKSGLIKGVYQARGLDYSTQDAAYTLDNLSRLNNQDQFYKDKEDITGILNRWKAKQATDKPRAVFLCVSGGGQRAALWTVNAMQQADSVLGGRLMDQTVLITGASGGVIGAAYYRELMLLRQQGEPIPSNMQQLENIGKDNLNSIIFSLLVNDAFFRVRKVDYEQKQYIRDRGYVFEENLNRNLQGVFSKKMDDYKLPESQADIPMLIMSPVIANDGRKLYLSPHSLTFMNMSGQVENGTEYKIRGVNFNSLFAGQHAQDLHFLSALRMSASFPYITPTITLPSRPAIEIMDAGISDNFGMSDAARFVEVFQDWLEENTSGVVLISIRDTRKVAPIEPPSTPSVLQRLTYPIASVYNNLANIQDINNDARVESMKTWLKVPVDLVELEYNTYTNIHEAYMLESKESERKQMERASLSWHLTTREKQNIIRNIDFTNNQRALSKLSELLQDEQRLEYEHLVKRNERAGKQQEGAVPSTTPPF